MSQPTPLFQARPLTTNATNNDTLNKKPLVTCGSYTDAYNTSMHQRQLQFFSYLAGFSVLLTLLFQSEITFNLYSIFNLLSWTTLYYSLLLCISGGIVFFMRFTTITIYEEVYPSVISRILAVCVSPDSWAILGLYALSSVITIFSYFSTLVDEEYVNNLFERPTGHYIDVRQLNQKNIFISLYAILLAAKYTTVYLAKRRHVAKITRVQQPLFYEMRGSMGTILYTSAQEALYVFLATYIIFIIFSGNIYYQVACAVGVFNRVLDSPIVGFRWIDLYLFTRVILSGTITTVLWNFVNRLFDAIFATTIPVTDAYANQFDCLLDGLTKKDEVIQATAFNELAQLACKNSKKRVELFGCIGKELQQSVWHRIMTACFQVIGELRMSVDTEYKGIQPVEIPSVPIVKSVEQKPRNRLQFSNDSGLYCTPRKHLNELDDRTGMIFGQVNELIESIPSLTNSSIVQQEKNDALAKINKVISILKTVEIKIGCKGYFSKFYEESRVARIQYVFRKHQLIIWAVQILGSLTAASYKEDSYGYVQNDISNVLNQLLGCFEDVEKYVQKETVAIEEVEAVKKALEEAILQIVVVFNDYLHIFKIDNKYKHIWKRFSCFH